MWRIYRKKSVANTNKILILSLLLCAQVMFNMVSPGRIFAAGVSPAALTVYGQNGNFTTNSASGETVRASTLSAPAEITVDSTNGVYIADTNDNRVLYFPSGTTTATRVYGQAGSFTTNTVNKGGISANSLNHPFGITLDQNNNLYVADASNNRVLFFPSGSTTATRVYGQGGSFTTNAGNKGGVTANSLNNPEGVALDSNNNLYIADTNNNRALVFPSGSTTATGVYGQSGTFNSSNINHGSLDANGVNHPASLILDSNNNLYIADTSNNRLLYFPNGTTTTATRVYGQNGSFTTNLVNNGGISARSLNAPEGVDVDDTNTLYVADTSNNRALTFRTVLRITTQPPPGVTVDTPFAIAASLIDAGSNQVWTDFTRTVTVAIKAGSGTPGASLSGTLLVSAINGVATFSNLTIDQSGTNYMLTVSSPGVSSADTISFAVTGSLVLTPLTNPTFFFVLNGTTGIITSQSTFTVNDTTQSGVGWHLTMTSTQLTTPGGKTLPTSSMTITQITTNCTTGKICILPTNTVGGYPLTVPAGTPTPPALTYFRVAPGTGTGNTTMTVTFSLRIPPGTAAGTYTTTLTESLVKGQ